MNIKVCTQNSQATNFFALERESTARGNQKRKRSHFDWDFEIFGLLLQRMSR